MATVTNRNRCATCEKQNVVMMCVGCSKDFCYDHMLNHRLELNKELDEIETHRDLIRHSINEQTAEPQKHSLIQEINRWEHQSINKIKQTANEARELLLHYTQRHIARVELNLNDLTDRIRQSRVVNDFIEANLNEWHQQIVQLKEQIISPSHIKIRYDSTPLITNIYADVPMQLFVPNIPTNAKWIQNGITVTGGKQGNGLNQLSLPRGVYVDDDQTMYVADYSNHRIMEWKNGATSGQVVAGGNGQGNRNDQLHGPSNVIVDKENDCLIICDSKNRRVVRWPRRNSTHGETIISNIDCCDLAMDNDEYLYVSDVTKHEVRRWKIGDVNGTLVAGGNGQGNRLNQLSNPYYIFVDQDKVVYVSDCNNHRVMKWIEGAQEGIIVAGNQSQGNSLAQLSYPQDVIVDQLGSVYVADCNNHRVMRWSKEAIQGSIISGGNGSGEQADQFNKPVGLLFDRQSNLYVIDHHNHRIQKFSIEPNTVT